ncbi:hypothetical protein [Streptomyces luteogriseus]|uniref:hypothetical protein n=1 Tax=Streptomyces luteogriseus TaxID=68233 RepID=UPI00260A02A1|nr:hypothetical protein [uncultured Streptomyces sp.]
MQFQDDLAGGVVLVRPALQSPDYVPGVSGWAVMIDGSAEFNDVTLRGTLESANYDPGVAGWHLDQDGSAEFNDVTIRGGTSVGGEAFYYNGTPGAGTLALSIASAAGTDPFGNAYVQGLGVYGPDGTVQALGAEFTVTGANGSAVNILTGGVGQATVDLVPRDLVGAVWSSASIYTLLGASNRPGLGLSSPAEDSNLTFSSIDLYGGGPTTSDTSILFSADRANFSDNVEVEGVLTAGNIQSGTVVITPTVANEWTANVAVVFPEAFTTTPALVLTCTFNGPGTGTTTELEWCATGVTTSGFNCRIRRGNLTATTLTWLAVST